MNISNVNRQSLPVTDRASPASKETRGSDASVENTYSPPSQTAAARPNPAAETRDETRKLEQEAEVARRSVQELVDRVTESTPAARRSLSFSVDDELGKTVVKVIDIETDKVIRQIPSEELLRFAQAIEAINQQHTAVADGGGDAAGLLIQERA